jgi:tight adherence protein B
MGIILTLFVVLAVGVFGLLSGFDRRGEPARMLRERLASIEQAAQRHPGEDLTLLRDELLSSVPALNQWLKRSNRVVRLQRFLSQADVKIRAGRFLLISACSGAAGFLLAQWFLSALPLAALGLLGGLLPIAFVAWRRQRRFHKFEALFPEAIDLLGRSMRAGHALNTSLEVIAVELAEPVAGEFRKMFDEQKFGLPMRDVLLNLTERMPLVDVKFFVTAVLLQRETGGNLAEMLDKISYLIRERFKLLRQVRVYTAQGRMTMGILMALPFLCALMMSTLSPTMFRLLYTDPIGKMLIGTGFLMMGMGYLLIRKIIRIRV